MTYCSPDRPFTFLDTPSFYSTALHLLSILAIPTHLFGAYCILFKTPERMISVKWSLLHLHFWTCFVDLGFNFLTLPIIFIPIFGGYTLGILQFLGFTMEMQTGLMITGIGAMGVSVVGIFENRYHVLSTDNHIWHRIRPLWFLGNFLLATMLFIPVYLTFPEDHVKGKEYVLKMLPCLPEEIKSADIFLSSENPALFLYLEGTLIGSLILQALSFYFLISRIFDHFGTKLSEKTLTMQKKLMRALIFQLILPLIIMVFPLAFCAHSTLIGYYNPTFNNFSFIIISLHGLLSTIAMITMHHPYRQEVLRLLRCQREEVSWKTGRKVTTTGMMTRKNTFLKN